MNLIEFHMDGLRVSIAAEQISSLRERTLGGCYIFMQHEEAPWSVDEEYDEVMQMVLGVTEVLPAEDFLVPGFLTGGPVQ